MPAQAQGSAFSLDAALAATGDFPERLGPVLVKELRQGLRSGFFVWPFRVLPLLLALQAAWAMSVGNVLDARAAAGSFFWLAMVAPMIVLGPLRGLGAIRSEREAQALDLLQLTPLSAWRIVLAKWSSLMAQAVLWAVALLPFFVLRYFLGGMDFVGEAGTLVWVVTMVGAAIAASLAASTLPRVLFWIVIGLASLVLLSTIPTTLAFMFAPTRGVFGGSGADMLEPEALVALGVLVHAGVLLLLYAASRIAPPADNYAARLRLGVLALFAWPVLLGLALGPGNDAWAVGLTATLLFAVVLAGLELARNEVPRAVHLRPWARLGPVGIVLSRLFMPGWPCALGFFTLLYAPAAMAAWIGVDPTGTDAWSLPLFLILGWVTVVLPRGVQCVLGRASADRPVWHLLVHLTGILGAIVMGVFHAIVGNAILLLGFLLPSSLALVTPSLDSQMRDWWGLVLVVAMTWVAFLVLLFVYHSRGYWQRLACLRASLRTGNPGAVHTAPPPVSPPVGPDPGAPPASS